MLFEETLYYGEPYARKPHVRFYEGYMRQLIFLLTCSAYNNKKIIN